MSVIRIEVPVLILCSVEASDELFATRSCQSILQNRLHMDTYGLYDLGSIKLVCITKLEFIYDAGFLVFQRVSEQSINSMLYCQVLPNIQLNWIKRLYRARQNK